MKTEITSLLHVKDAFPQLASIGAKATGRNPVELKNELDRYARRGADCVLLYCDDVIVGYLIFGHIDKFVNWSKNIPLKARLSQEGIEDVYTTCHIHVLPEYLGQGNTTLMQKSYGEHLLNKNVLYILLWGYATDQLCEFSLSRPGARVFEGLYDNNGRRVGIRNLKAHIAALN